MIQSFGDKVTEDLFHGRETRSVQRLAVALRRTARRKLDMLDAAHILEDLRSPPGNHLEALRGDLAGFHSIRVNDQWRLVFRWTDAGPAAVKLTDYH